MTDFVENTGLGVETTTSPPDYQLPPFTFRLPEAEISPKLPFPLSCRIAAIEIIQPNSITMIPRDLIDVLSTNNSLDAKTVQLLQLHGNDKDKTLNYLNFILRNPDVADFLARLNPQKEYDVDTMALFLVQWKHASIASLINPKQPLPEKIEDETGKQQYLTTVTPIRPGLTQTLEKLKKHTRESQIFMFALRTSGLEGTDALVDDWTHYTYRRDLSALSERGANTILNAAEIAISLTADEPSSRQQVVASVIETIKSQDKYWVFGEDGIDSLTENLLTLLSKNNIPEAVPAILDTLYRKIIQDEPFILSMIYSSEELQLHYGTTIRPAIEKLVNLAVQTDKKAVEKYLGDHFRDRGISYEITDIIGSRPEFHNQTISLGPNRETEYFGKKFIYTDLPEGIDVNLKELTFGKVVAEDPQGRFLGLYEMDPSIYPTHQKDVKLHKIAPESVFFWTLSEKNQITPDKFERFLKDFARLTEGVAPHISSAISTAVLPLPAYYQLWEFLDGATAENRMMADKFLEEFGPTAMYSLITGEYGRDNIPKVMRFALQTQKPKVHDEDSITHIRLNESFTETVLREYADLAFFSWEYAATISPTPEHAREVHELILQRGKALLLAAAKTFEKKNYLSENDEAFIRASFRFNKLFLMSLADQSGELARSISMPYGVVREFFRFHDPTDPDSRAMFNTAMELWFEKYIREQNLAEYRGKVEDITLEFYQAYDELEKDSAKTTADPTLEKERYKSSLQYDLARGYLPKEATKENPFTVGFIGIGNGRMEKEIIDELKANTKGYRFIGIDINRPASLPEDVEFHRLNMKDLGREMPGKFNRLYYIWSPFMDVLELDELLDVAESASLACLAKNPLEKTHDKDEPPPIVELDIHFPFGSHSYEEIIAKHHAANPQDPEGMMYRDFEREGKSPVGKRFFASDPVLVNAVFGLYGFEIENLPQNPQEIIDLCTNASRDDSFIPQGPQDKLDKQAVYLTGSGANRITYKLKGVRMRQTPESILALRNQIKAGYSQGAFITIPTASSQKPA